MGGGNQKNVIHINYKQILNENIINASLMKLLAIQHVSDRLMLTKKVYIKQSWLIFIQQIWGK